VKIAIQTSLLPGTDLTERFANAASFGFDAVELVVGPVFDLEEHVTDVQRAMEASGLPVAAICTHSMHDPLVPKPEERERRFAALSRLVELAGNLGAGGVVSVPVRPPHVFPGPGDPPGEPLEVAAVAFDRWVETLKSGPAAIFLEPLNRYEAKLLNRVEQAAAICEAVGHPRVRALADLFHMNIEESSMAAPIAGAAAHLGHIHLADNNRLQPGAGCFDFTAPFAALKAIDYDGYLGLECSLRRGPAPDDRPEVALPETARFLREQWERAGSSTPAA